MTTPNIEELIAKLSYYSGDGVQIDMARQAQRQAADALQSQAERIKKLERTPQVGYFYKWKEAMHGIARLMDERDTLRAQLAEIENTEPVLVVEKEPDYWSGGHFHEGSRSYIKPTKVWSLPIGTELFTRPMPPQIIGLQDVHDAITANPTLADCAQDVTEFDESQFKSVEDLIAHLNKLNSYRDKTLEALSKYKGAK